MSISPHQPTLACSLLRPIHKPEAPPLPVKGVEVTSVINQDIASVTINQVFINSDIQPIEVEYIFPFPSSSTLTSLKIYTQGKIIEAQVKELEEAKQDFADALASGDNAYMAQISSLQDVATLQIGLIKSQEEVRVEITYAVECKFEKDHWKLIIPTVLIPRYASSEQIGSADSSQRWKFSCELNTNTQARDVKCNFNQSIPQPISETCILLTSSGSALPDIDLEVSYSTLQISEPFALVQRDPRTNALGIHFSFQPPSVTASLEDFEPSGEFILVLDRSGSMSGGSIETAKQAVQLFIKSLPEKSLFNIVSFGSTFSSMFSASSPYSTQSVEGAINQVKSFGADMGGTEIYGPLFNILDSEPSGGFPRYVFLITDGGVGNVKQIIDLVEANHKNTRVSTIGIGSGASTELVEKVALAGKGSSTMILDLSNIKEGVLYSLERSLQPTLNDVTIEWLSGEVIAQHPTKPFYAFNGDRLAFNAAIQDTGVPVAFKVSYYDSLSDERKAIEFENDLSQIKSGNESIALAVKGAVGTPDEVRLALMFQVLTKKVALIATCRGEGETLDRAPTLVQVALRHRSQDEGGINYGGHAVGSPAMRMGIASPRICSIAPSSFCSMPSGPPPPPLPQFVSLPGMAPQLPYMNSMPSAQYMNSMQSMPQSPQIMRMEMQEKQVSWRGESEDELEDESEEFEKEQESSRSSSATTKFGGSQAELLINAQNSDGSWSISADIERIFSLLGVGFAAAQARHSDIPETVLATALVCAVLAEKLRESEGMWKLAASKGVRWLRKQGAQKMTLSELFG